MNSNSKKSNRFSQGKILLSEPKFIDSYTNKKLKLSPIKLLFSFYKGHYAKLCLSALFHIINTSPLWLVPLVSTDIINIVIERPDDALKKILIDSVIIVIAFVQNIPFYMLEVKYRSEVNRSIEAGLRGAMIRKLQQLSITFHKKMASGKIQSKVMRDVESISEFSTQMFAKSLDVFFQIGVTLAIVITKNITVFFMFLVCVPIAAIIRNRFIKPIRKQSHEFRKEIENTAAAVYDMEELIPITRAHALENNEVRKMTAEVANIAERGYKLDKIQSLFVSVNWVAFSLMQAACLFFTSWLAFNGRISVGEIALYQTYFNALTGHVSAIMGLLPIIAKGNESIRSVGEILSAYDIEDNRQKQIIKDLKGKYEFKNVNFKYDDQTHVLHDFNLTVNPGETVALVGESGSGKSTVMNLVIGFNKPSSGELFIDDKNIDELNLRSYRRMISVVPQNSILFSGTIRDNITYGRKNITEEQLKNAIHMAQLDSVIAKLPNGLDTFVGEHGDHLSGGQRQRICIARAIIRNPKVIIFDEATSALDSVTEREIQSAIDNLTKDRTTFIVAHRLSTIKNADKIAVLRDGRCVEFGTYDELLAKKGEFYNYKQIQS